MNIKSFKYQFICLVIYLLIIIISVPIILFFSAKDNVKLTKEIIINERIDRKVKIKGGSVLLNNKYTIDLIYDEVSTYNHDTNKTIGTPFDLIKNPNSDTIWIIKGNDSYYRILLRELR